MVRLKVLLVDDSPAFRSAARSCLAALPCVGAVDSAESAAQALARAREMRPDAVLVDLVMPGESGFELMRLMRALPHPPEIIAVTLHEGAEFHAAVSRSGARALVPKRAFPERISQLLAELAAAAEERGRPPALRRAADAIGERRRAAGASAPPPRNE